MLKNAAIPRQVFHLVTVRSALPSNSALTAARTHGNAVCFSAPITLVYGAKTLAKHNCLTPLSFFNVFFIVKYMVFNV